MNNATAVPKPYDPDTVSLRTKIERHLRRKGWKRRSTDHKWINPATGEGHTLTAAVRRQLHLESRP